MKLDIIILDIDGVLATEESSTLPWHEQFAYPFDKDCVAVFNDILSLTGAEIVLSSDWKISYSDNLAELHQLFKHNGIIKAPIGTTPDLGGKRNKEIASYLHKNAPSIYRFLILDDIMLTVHPMRFVHCNINHGLKQPGIKERCLQILQTDQSTIFTCINCEKEFYASSDLYTCSEQCRKEIETIKNKDKHGITDEAIRIFQLQNLLGQ